MHKLKKTLLSILIIGIMIAIIPPVIFHARESYASNNYWHRVSSDTENVIIKSEIKHGKSGMLRFTDGNGDYRIIKSYLQENYWKLNEYKYTHPYCLELTYDLYENLNNSGEFKKYYSMKDFNPLDINECRHKI